MASPVIFKARIKSKLQSKLIDNEDQMVVKSLSVPPGLEILMELLTKKVLQVQPQDICEFAADYFANLSQLKVVKEKNIRYKKVQQKSAQFKQNLNNNANTIQSLVTNLDNESIRSEVSTAEIDKIYEEREIGFKTQSLDVPNKSQDEEQSTSKNEVNKVEEINAVIDTSDSENRILEAEAQIQNSELTEDEITKLLLEKQSKVEEINSDNFEAENQIQTSEITEDETIKLLLEEESKINKELTKDNIDEIQLFNKNKYEEQSQSKNETNKVEEINAMIATIDSKNRILEAEEQIQVSEITDNKITNHLPVNKSKINEELTEDNIDEIQHSTKDQGKEQSKSKNKIINSDEINKVILTIDSKNKFLEEEKQIQTSEVTEAEITQLLLEKELKINEDLTEDNIDKIKVTHLTIVEESVNAFDKEKTQNKESNPKDNSNVTKLNKKIDSIHNEEIDDKKELSENQIANIIKIEEKIEKNYEEGNKEKSINQDEFLINEKINVQLENKLEKNNDVKQNKDVREEIKLIEKNKEIIQTEESDIDTSEERTALHQDEELNSLQLKDTIENNYKIDEQEAQCLKDLIDNKKQKLLKNIKIQDKILITELESTNEEKELLNKENKKDETNLTQHKDHTFILNAEGCNLVKNVIKKDQEKTLVKETQSVTNEEDDANMQEIDASLQTSDSQKETLNELGVTEKFSKEQEPKHKTDNLIKIETVEENILKSQVELLNNNLASEEQKTVEEMAHLINENEEPKAKNISELIEVETLKVQEENLDNNLAKEEEKSKEEIESLIKLENNLKTENMSLLVKEKTLDEHPTNEIQEPKFIQDMQHVMNEEEKLEVKNILELQQENVLKEENESMASESVTKESKVENVLELKEENVLKQEVENITTEETIINMEPLKNLDNKPKAELIKTKVQENLETKKEDDKLPLITKNNEIEQNSILSEENLETKLNVNNEENATNGDKITTEVHFETSSTSISCKEIEENHKLTMDISKQNIAAATIQALWRGFNIRRNINNIKIVKKSKNEILAATKIQSLWRGFNVRQKRNIGCILQNVNENVMDKKDHVNDITELNNGETILSQHTEEKLVPSDTITKETKKSFELIDSSKDDETEMQNSNLNNKKDDTITTPEYDIDTIKTTEVFTDSFDVPENVKQINKEILQCSDELKEEENPYQSSDVIQTIVENESTQKLDDFNEDIIHKITEETKLQELQQNEIVENKNQKLQETALITENSDILDGKPIQENTEEMLIITNISQKEENSKNVKVSTIAEDLTENIKGDLDSLNDPSIKYVKGSATNKEIDNNTETEDIYKNKVTFEIKPDEEIQSLIATKIAAKDIVDNVTEIAEHHANEVFNESKSLQENLIENLEETAQETISNVNNEIDKNISLLEDIKENIQDSSENVKENLSSFIENVSNEATDKIVNTNESSTTNIEIIDNDSHPEINKELGKNIQDFETELLKNTQEEIVTLQNNLDDEVVLNQLDTISKNVEKEIVTNESTEETKKEIANEDTTSKERDTSKIDAKTDEIIEHKQMNEKLDEHDKAILIENDSTEQDNVKYEETDVEKNNIKNKTLVATNLNEAETYISKDDKTNETEEKSKIKEEHERVVLDMVLNKELTEQGNEKYEEKEDQKTDMSEQLSVAESLNENNDAEKHVFEEVATEIIIEENQIDKKIDKSENADVLINESAKQVTVNNERKEFEKNDIQEKALPKEIFNEKLVAEEYISKEDNTDEISEEDRVNEKMESNKQVILKDENVLSTEKQLNLKQNEREIVEYDTEEATVITDLSKEVNTEINVSKKKEIDKSNEENQTIKSTEENEKLLLEKETVLTNEPTKEVNVMYEERETKINDDKKDADISNKADKINKESNMNNRMEENDKVIPNEDDVLTTELVEKFNKKYKENEIEIEETKEETATNLSDNHNAEKYISKKDGPEKLNEENKIGNKVENTEKKVVDENIANIEFEKQIDVKYEEKEMENNNTINKAMQITVNANEMHEAEKCTLKNKNNTEKSIENDSNVNETFSTDEKSTSDLKKDKILNNQENESIDKNNFNSEVLNFEQIKDENKIAQIDKTNEDEIYLLKDVDSGNSNQSKSNTQLPMNDKSLNQSTNESENQLDEIEALNLRLQKLTQTDLHREDNLKPVDFVASSSNVDIPLEIFMDDFDSSKYNLKEPLTPRSKSKNTTPIHQLTTAAYKIGAGIVVNNESVIEAIDNDGIPKKDDKVDYIHIPLQGPVPDEVEQLIKKASPKLEQVPIKKLEKSTGKGDSPEYIYIPLKDPNKLETETDDQQLVVETTKDSDYIIKLLDSKTSFEENEDTELKNTDGNSIEEKAKDFTNVNKVEVLIHNTNNKADTPKKQILVFEEKTSKQLAITADKKEEDIIDDDKAMRNTDLFEEKAIIDKEVSTSTKTENFIHKTELEDLNASTIGEENVLQTVNTENAETEFYKKILDKNRQIRIKEDFDKEDVEEPITETHSTVIFEKCDLEENKLDFLNKDENKIEDIVTTETINNETKTGRNEVIENLENSLQQKSNITQKTKTRDHKEDNVSKEDSEKEFSENLTNVTENVELLDSDNVNKNKNNSNQNLDESKKEEKTEENHHKANVNHQQSNVDESKTEVNDTKLAHLMTKQNNIEETELENVSQESESKTHDKEAYNKKSDISLISNTSEDSELQSQLSTPANDQLLSEDENNKSERTLSETKSLIKQASLISEVDELLQLKKPKFISDQEYLATLSNRKLFDEIDSLIEKHKQSPATQITSIKKEKSGETNIENDKLNTTIVQTEENSSSGTDETYTVGSPKAFSDEEETKNTAASKIQECYRNYRRTSISHDSYFGNKADNATELEDQFLDLPVKNTFTENKTQEELKDISEMSSKSVQIPNSHDFKMHLDAIPEAISPIFNDNNNASSNVNPDLKKEIAYDPSILKEMKPEQSENSSAETKSDSTIHEADNDYEQEDNNETETPSKPTTMSNPGLQHSGEMHDSLDIFLSSEELSQAGAAMLTSQDARKTNDPDDVQAQSNGGGDVTRGHDGDRRERSGHSGMEAASANNSRAAKKATMVLVHTRNNIAPNTEAAVAAAAATKIQAGFRGYQVRKQMKLKKDDNNTKGTKRRRSSLRRDTSKSTTDLEEKSAIKIQAGIRGFLVRKRQKNAKSKQA